MNGQYASASDIRPGGLSRAGRPPGAIWGGSACRMAVAGPRRASGSPLPILHRWKHDQGASIAAPLVAGVGPNQRAWADAVEHKMPICQRRNTPAGTNGVWFFTLTTRNGLDVSGSQWNTSPICCEVGNAVGL